MEIVTECREKEPEEDEDQVLHIYCLRSSVQHCNEHYLSKLVSGLAADAIYEHPHSDGTRLWTEKYLKLYQHRKELYLRGMEQWKMLSGYVSESLRLVII